MPTKKNTRKKAKNMNVLEIGTGVAAAAIAAGVAGYYFYGSTEAKKHRKATATWANDLQKRVVTSAKKVKNVNAKTIAGIVDEAAAAYQGIRGVDPKEVRRAALELKSNWNQIKKELGGTTKTVKKVSKKIVQKKK